MNAFYIAVGMVGAYVFVCFALRKKDTIDEMYLTRAKSEQIFLKSPEVYSNIDQQRDLWELRRQYLGIADPKTLVHTGYGMAKAAHEPGDMSFLEEYMLASIYYKYREHLSRTARTSIITCQLLTQLELVGLCLHFLAMDEGTRLYAYPGFAVALSLPIPLLLIPLFRVSNVAKYGAGG